MGKWKKALADRIESTADLPSDMKRRTEGVELPFAVTHYYLSLADGRPDHPVARQFLPSEEETRIVDYELVEPLGEDSHSPVFRLIHRYKNRCVFLSTDFCAVYCRHCFRRSFTSCSRGAASPGEIKAAAEYLKRHTEVEELLVSGGDPLTLTVKTLRTMLALFREARPDLLIRIGTRIPVVLPSRITTNLAEMLADFRPLWISTQFNHPAELTREALTATGKLLERGIPIMNQSVLLRGINDEVPVLAELSRRLLAASIKPYYLFQGDLARGTAHFRVNLKRGLDLVRRLRIEVSGLGMPQYAVDLPGGGGKIPLVPQYLVAREAGGYRYRSQEGVEYYYPLEEEEPYR